MSDLCEAPDHPSDQALQGPILLPELRNGSLGTVGMPEWVRAVVHNKWCSTVRPCILLAHVALIKAYTKILEITPTNQQERYQQPSGKIGKK